MFANNLYKLMVKPRVTHCGAEIKMRSNRDQITGPVGMRTGVQIGRTRLEKCMKLLKPTGHVMHH